MSGLVGKYVCPSNILTLVLSGRNWPLRKAHGKCYMSWPNDCGIAQIEQRRP